MLCEPQQPIKLNTQKFWIPVDLQFNAIRVNFGSYAASLFSVVSQLLSHFVGANTDRVSPDQAATLLGPLLQLLPSLRAVQVLRGHQRKD